MAINAAHANRGVLLYNGESILIYAENAGLEFETKPEEAFHGKKIGKVYLTSHRIVFINNLISDRLKSISMPFVTLREMELDYPIFGSCSIKGRVIPQQNGNFEGRTCFSLRLRSGGTQEFYKALLRAADLVTRELENHVRDFCRTGRGVPRFTSPSGPWFAAPPPSYYPPKEGYKGWTVPEGEFTMAPKPNEVFSLDDEPPYPGLIPNEPSNDLDELEIPGEESCRSSISSTSEPKLFPRLDNDYGKIAGYPPPGPPLGIDGWKPSPRPITKIEMKCDQEDHIIWI